MKIQELFDTVATHLLTQKKRATNTHGCAYRGENGLKCAVGCLIPDSKYDPELEGSCASARAVAKAAGLRGEQQRLLAEKLQAVHDDDHPSTWHGALHRVAAEFNLKTTVLDSTRV